MKSRYPDLKMRIKEQLHQYSISPKRDLGQNFICDYQLIMEELKYANINKNDIVLEIGAGIGTLTEFLAKRAKKVIAIEKDTQFTKILSNIQSKYDNIDTIYADALDIDYPKFNKVVSNLPFKIALPLIFKILNYEFELGVLLCQERLARRICAKPGQKGYSRLSVQISRISNTVFLKTVPAESFYPNPKVTSAMIKIKKIHPKFSVPSDEFFKEVLKFLFAIREKNLRVALSILVKMGVSYSKIKRIKTSINKSLLKKPIYLISPREFGKITWLLYGIVGEDIIEYFYKFYRIKNLYNKGGVLT